MPTVSETIMTLLSKQGDRYPCHTTKDGFRIYLDKDITDSTLYLDIELHVRYGCVGCDQSLGKIEQNDKGSPC